MTTYNDRLAAYIQQTFAAEDAVLQQIRAQIPARGLPEITIQPDEGRFLQFLVAVSGARQVLEIGTLGGYSGTWMARGLPPGGRLITLEVDPHHAAVAVEHFRQAGLEKIVEVRLGDAHQLLPELAGEFDFDFVFIDAEKPGYPAYLDWSLTHLGAGGVLAAHNAFRQGALIDVAANDENVSATRIFLQRLAEHPQAISTIFPAGDGMAVAVIAPSAAG